MNNLKIEYIPVEKLVKYEKNTRKHEEYDVNQIKTSIEKNGFNDPIGIWKNNIIIEGHGRLEAAQALGMEQVPVIRLDHLTDEERREYAIMHNKTAELSKWDFVNLELEVEDLDLSDFDINFAFSLKPENTETDFTEFFDNAEEMLPDEYDKSIEDEYGEAELPATVITISCEPETVEFIKFLIHEDGELKRLYHGKEIMERFNEA